jgi:hypothetical protein
MAAKIRYGVQCTKHGMKSDKLGWHILYVAAPRNGKKQKTTGCSACKAEAAQAAREAAVELAKTVAEQAVAAL